MNRRKEKIFLTESSKDDELKALLKTLNYDIIPVNSYDEILPKALEEKPALIIGDFENFGRPPHEVCKMIKDNILFRHIPLIIVTDSGTPQERIAAAKSGVSDYILKPFHHEEALARINRSIQNIRHALNANPLTCLPGNIAIHEYFEWLIQKKAVFAAAYFDIDNFKSYNDMYGYAAGDRIISLTAGMIIECKEKFKSYSENIFVGHIGGDDFIMICPEEMVQEFCEDFIAKFDSAIPFEYDEKISKQGFIIGRDRRGNVTAFPLVSVSIAVVVNENGNKFKHMGEIAGAGAEIKKYLKSLPGSSYLIDRRFK